MGPVSGTPTPILNVAGTLVRVSAESTLQAFLFAPNALLTLDRSALVKGSFRVSTRPTGAVAAARYSWPARGHMGRTMGWLPVTFTLCP
jgi:hypothetical protein